MRRRTADFLQGEFNPSDILMPLIADVMSSVAESETRSGGEGEEDGKWENVQGARMNSASTCLSR